MILPARRARRVTAGVLCLVLAACSGGGGRGAGQPEEHPDGEGALEALGDQEVGQVVEARPGVTRTLGGLPLCNRDGHRATLAGIEPARLVGDVEVSFVGVRTARYHDAGTGTGEPETLAPSAEGTLRREDFAGPAGFEVLLSCDDKPEIVEVALEYTFTTDRGGAIDGVRVDYRDERGKPFTFVVQRIVLGCGTGELEPRLQRICDERD